MYPGRKSVEVPMDFELRKREVLEAIRLLFVEATDNREAMLAMDTVRQYAEELRDEARDE